MKHKSENIETGIHRKRESINQKQWKGQIKKQRDKEIEE